MRATTLAIALLGSVTFATPADAQLITQPSPHPVAETVDRLEEVVQEAGLRVFARFDHALGAASVDMALPPTQLLIFGNPQLGTPLMQSERTIGLDLPLRVLVWQDAEGQVQVTYTDPAALRELFGITDQDPLFERMTGALARFVGAATAE